MFREEEIKRYSRHFILPEIGRAGQEKLKNAKVLVVGAGGLGCPVLQYLAAAGVGSIGIADYDIVDESNLHRQILYTFEDVGKSKALVAKAKLALLNPHIELKAYEKGISIENVLDIFSGYEIIVDGSDSFSTRYLVNDACVILNKPLVFSSIHKFEGQVSVFNFNNGPTYRCLYPDPPGPGEMPACSETGVIGVLPGIAGTLQANEVIKIICGLGEVLSGKLLSFNALSLEINQFSIESNPENKNITNLRVDEVTCESVPEISYEQLKNEESGFLLIDVRSEDEHKEKNISGQNIPLNKLEDQLVAFEKKSKLIFYCASGRRSLSAATIAFKKGFRNVAHLKGGLAAIAER